MMDLKLDLPQADCAADIPQREFMRLAGYPMGRAATDADIFLFERARLWFTKHGRPWSFLRLCKIEAVEAECIRIEESRLLRSPFLAGHLREAHAEALIAMAASAGIEAEDQVVRLWSRRLARDAFALDAYASAVVEHLTSQCAAKLCCWAADRGRAILPPCSPGSPDWDLSDQAVLLSVLRSNASLPEHLELLPSGMLKPEKSLLAVFGVAPLHGAGEAMPAFNTCSWCSFAGCSFRRLPQSLDTLGNLREPRGGVRGRPL